MQLFFHFEWKMYCFLLFTFAVLYYCYLSRTYKSVKCRDVLKSSYDAKDKVYLSFFLPTFLTLTFREDDFLF